MLKSSQKIQPIYFLIDLFFMLIAFLVPYTLKYNDLRNIHVDIKLPNFMEYSFVFIIQVVFIAGRFKRKRLYSTNREITISQELMHVAICIIYAGVITGSIVFFAHYTFFSRFIFVTNLVLLVVLLGGFRVVKRLVLRRLIREGFRNINVLIVGMGKTSRLVVAEIRARAYLGFKIAGLLGDFTDEQMENLPVLGKISDFTTVAKKYFIDEVLVTISPEKEGVAELIKQTQKMRIGVRLIPEQFEEEPLHIVDVGYFGVLPILTCKVKKPHSSEVASKKIFDFVASLMLIILLLPVFIIIAVLIKIGSSGSVFFVGQRLGLKGTTFNFYKFRSMVENADVLKSELAEENEVEDKIMFKIRKDPRVTRIGKFLRKYSLDELPQLFNVLKGDMSLVGPRPPLAGEVEKYDSHHLDRLSIKPGITGLSQIKGRSDLSFSRWFKWDLWYLNHWSFWLDMKILWWTIPAVLKGRGAY
jgi:exopolysaccharide biosynthesis polyprenyl glycosylphosphotransferase